MTSDMQCVFVDNGKRQVPVPLWFQYTATWRDVDFENAKWINVTNTEWWARAIVNAMTNTPTRVVAKTSGGYSRKEFVARMTTARTTSNLPLSHSGSEAEEQTETSRTTAAGRAAVLEVTIWGFTSG